MKAILVSSILVFSFQLLGQCVSFVEDSITTCAGTPVTFTAFPQGSLLTTNASLTFDSGMLPSGWTVGGAATFSQPCIPGINNTPYYWASSAGTGVPFIQSPPFDFSNGGVIDFDFVYSVQGGASPCEGPDLANEGIAVQYSVDNGATWFDIAYYSPDGNILPSNPYTVNSVATGPTPFTVWNSETLPIPIGAQTTSTIIRWYQEFSSGTCCDNWGVDNVQLQSIIPGITTSWSNGVTNSYTITESNATSTSYVISLYDGTNALICQDTCYLDIYTGGFDNAVQVISGPFVQGQQAHIIVDAYNDGCPPQSGEIVVQLDPLVSFVSSTPSPDIISNDSLIYFYSNLFINGPHTVIPITLQTSTSAVVGDVIDIDAMIDPIAGDINPNNNIKNYAFTVLASYDPNDKKVYPIGDCDPGYVLNDQLMTYTIRFQNTGTFEATDIYIRDVLSPNLNASTLKVVATSHEVKLDWINATTVDFKFDSILLPYEATDPIGSVGYVVFEIEQMQGLSHGTPFTNQVEIFFDFNPPITTNEVFNTVSDGSHYIVGDTLFINAPSIYVWHSETLTSSGVYSQVFPLPDGCDSTAYLSLTLDSDVGLNASSKDLFAIFPNPANDHLTVKGNATGTLRMIDASGTIILEKLFSGEDSILLNSIAAGFYFIEVESDNSLHRFKILVQK